MKKLVIPLLMVIWLSLLFIFLVNLNIGINPKPPEITSSKLILSEAKVKRVIDGDTVELENGAKVRYIGINTPEMVDPRRPIQCFGQEAKEENRKLVEGKIIKLEKDVSEIDKYGRLLRYVYVDSLFVNDYLVKNGFAQVATFPPDVKHQEQFLASQKEAKVNNLGLWENCSRK